MDTIHSSNLERATHSLWRLSKEENHINAMDGTRLLVEYRNSMNSLMSRDCWMVWAEAEAED